MFESWHGDDGSDSPGCSKSPLFLGELVLLLIILVKYHPESFAPPLSHAVIHAGQSGLISNVGWSKDARNLLWDGKAIGAGRILLPDEGFCYSAAS